MASRIKGAVLNPTATALHRSRKRDEENEKKKYANANGNVNVDTRLSHPKSSALTARSTSTGDASKLKWGTYMEKELSKMKTIQTLDWEFITLLLREHGKSNIILRGMDASMVGISPNTSSYGMQMQMQFNPMAGLNFGFGTGTGTGTGTKSGTASLSNIDGDTSTPDQAQIVPSNADAGADANTEGVSAVISREEIFRQELSMFSAQISMDIMTLSIRTNLPITLIKREYLRYRRRSRTRIRAQEEATIELKLMQDMHIPIVIQPPPIPIDSCLTGSVHGLPNYGQTCFFNAVMQALASSNTFIRYLERVVFLLEAEERIRMEKKKKRDANANGGFGILGSLSLSRLKGKKAPLSRLLLELLTYVNCCIYMGGHDGESSSASLSSSSKQITKNQAHQNIPKILDRLAGENEQFRSYRFRHGQQDAQECLQALIAMVIEESGLEKTNENKDSDADDDCAQNDRIGIRIGASLFSLSELGIDEDGSAKSENDNGNDDSVEEMNINDNGEASNKNSEDEESQTPDVSKIQIKLEPASGVDAIEKTVESVEAVSGCKAQIMDTCNDPIDKDTDEVETLKNITAGSKSRTSKDLTVVKSNLPRPIQLMIKTLSYKTPSPLNGCLGSRLECCECRHVRPIHDSSFLEIPIVPTAISKTMLKSSAVPCSLVECLTEFAEEETVEGVNCRACPIQAELKDLMEEKAMLQDATESIMDRGADESEASGLKEELRTIQDRIDFLKDIDPDADEEDNESEEDIEEASEFLDINLDGNNAVPKPRKTDAKKRLMVTRLPPVLFFHVKRLYFNPATSDMAKTNQHINFTEYLDMRCVYAGDQTSLEERDGKESVNAQPIPYRLVSVIEHRGSAFSGHYFTMRRASISSSWVLVDDQRVTQITWNDVRKCNAYMLIYEAC